MFSIFCTSPGKTLRERPLEERRELLRVKVMPRTPEEISLSETLEATVAEIVAAVRKQGLEGVIAKRRDSLYEPGRRSGAWVKMRINERQELVIGGYVPAPKNFDCLSSAITSATTSSTLRAFGMVSCRR
jgi:ATP-dependent DNA ligase